MNIRLNQLNKIFFPEIVTHFPAEDKKLYLTFDDGPTQGVTPRVLALLSDYNAKATFFCRGDKVVNNKEVFEKILEQGHAVGNHSLSHLNGWHTKTSEYVEDCRKASLHIPSRIFRPPYGKITPGQYKELKKEYTIYLWTALSWDFHPWVSSKMCYRISRAHISAGSILVFHDTQKASKNLFYTLPRILEEGCKKGLEFSALI